ncbi:MAG: DNA polymerase III subunit delta [Deltaproteobacteria bacterium]|nr:DNA polymerase III subunit delta [Deltaproteobacteria bacterium]
MPPRKAVQGGDPLAHLESGPRPVYIVDGEERVLVDEAVAAIKSKSLGRAADFNFDAFVAKETPIEKILSAARMLPVFAPRRLVIVKDADKLTADDGRAMESYVVDPTPDTVLVLLGQKFDGRLSLYKSVQKHGLALRFEHPQERQMPGLIRDRAKRRGISLDEGAIVALVAAVGTDLSAAISALEKLSLFAGSRLISASDVEEVVSNVREQSIFALTDAVGVGDTASALEVLHGTMGPGRSHPLPVLGAISTHWRKLARARSLLDAGQSPQAVASDLGGHPFAAQKSVDQARGQTGSALLLGLVAIAEADRGLKGGKLEPEHVMERLVLTLAGGGQRSRSRRA